MQRLWIISVGVSILLFLWPVFAYANVLQASLFAQPSTTPAHTTPAHTTPASTMPTSTTRASTVPVPEPAPEGAERGGTGPSAAPVGASSLFQGRAAGGLFAAIAPQNGARGQGRYSFALRPGVVGLRDLIGRAEAGRANYDAVQHGARIKTSKPPTQMTIREIYAWIRATPGQPHAIGRYQFIPSTLRRVVRETGIPESARFSPQVQDALADVLFSDAGIEDFMAGRITQTRFMNNLAKIWAGFPNSSGRSHYHGYAGNYATLSWSEFKSAISRIFPRG